MRGVYRKTYRFQATKAKAGPGLRLLPVRYFPLTGYRKRAISGGPGRGGT